jgi:hypothetical protein
MTALRAPLSVITGQTSVSRKGNYQRQKQQGKPLKRKGRSYPPSPPFQMRNGLLLFLVEEIPWYNHTPPPSSLLPPQVLCAVLQKALGERIDLSAVFVDYGLTVKNGENTEPLHQVESLYFHSLHLQVCCPLLRYPWPSPSNYFRTKSFCG